jgi:hypothetical protein
MSFFIPPPAGFHEAERNADGTLRGKLDPKDAEKRAAKMKSDMEKYQARSREVRQKLLDSAAGIKEEPVAPAPKDELALIEMNFLAEPGLLQGKGAVPLQMLTEEQKRSQQRASLDAKAEAARKHLDKTLNPDQEERSGHNLDSYAGISEEEAERILNSDDDDDDPYSAWVGFDIDEESENE